MSINQEALETLGVYRRNTAHILGEGSEVVKAIDTCIKLVEEAQPKTAKQTVESEQNVSDWDLISRKSAIDALGERPDVWTESDWERGQASQWDYDVLAIESVPSAQPEQRWIPVSDLPKEEGRYLCTQRKYVWIYSFSKDLYDLDEYDFPNHGAGWYGYDNEYGFYEAQDVTAWMPLPEPYKEGGE